MELSKKTLEQLLWDGLEKLYSDNKIDFSGLYKAISYMRFHEMIAEDTSMFFKVLFSNPKMYPLSYYEDGTVEYAIGQDAYEEMDMENCLKIKINPYSMIAFVFKCLQEDRKLQAFFSFESLDDLLFALSEFEVSPEEILFLDAVDVFAHDTIYCEGIAFYFTEHSGNLQLRYVRINDINMLWNPYGGNLLRECMGGSIYHLGKDFFFGFFRGSAILHLNLESSCREIIQNAIFLGALTDGHIVVRDTITDEIGYYECGLFKKICVASKQMNYYATDDYVLVNPKNEDIQVPYHIRLDGSIDQCTQIERAEYFWNYILKRDTYFIESPYRLSDLMYACKINWLVKGIPLTLKSMKRTFYYIAGEKKWKKGKAFTFEGIMKRLERSGFDELEDISNEMVSLLKYNQECLILNKDPFDRIFYFIVYRLSKDVNFKEKLIHAPEKLFEKDLISKEIKEEVKKKNEEYLTKIKSDLQDEYEGLIYNSDYIGRFRKIETGFEVECASLCRGRIVGNRIVPYDACDRDWDGSVSFDMTSEKYIIEGDLKEKEESELCTLFGHRETDCIFGYGKRVSRENDHEKGDDAINSQEDVDPDWETFLEDISPDFFPET